MNEELVFFDTEFTGLGQSDPGLISIGLVTETGRHAFYAELPPESYVGHVSPWVQENVIPLLEGGNCVKTIVELRQCLTDWLGDLGPVRLVTDAPSYDFALLQTILNPWPENVATRPIWFDTYALGSEHQDLLETQFNAFFSAGKPQHHALCDAKALCRMWQRAKPLDAFHSFLRSVQA